MIAVEISKVGQANKVKCISVLCSVAGLSIVESKEVIEAVISGKTQRVEIEDEEHADRLCEFLQMEGAQAVVLKGSDCND